ncbi:Non-hemolytic phospholipase C [Escovopsis weberi]|uniref:Non-hemolytic phospholipase C n=1 Tax=Escovopsis weberi TaxID=150374 RepID=A0A0M8N8Z9_ESCWE|nr:Non-hemolytic phospholipase C [Escovopsis weberi]
MAGTRGFADANLQMNGNVSVFAQVTDPRLTDAPYVYPWYINYQGGNAFEATECSVPGSNDWSSNRRAINGGRMDHWAVNNTAWSLAFKTRREIPTHFALAENFVVLDHYQEGVIAPTDPNRVMWLTGSINVPGGPQKPNQGGNPYIDNIETPGCQGPRNNQFNCYPLDWTTAGEIYEENGVTWSVFQDDDNFDDNDYVHFRNFQNAPANSSLYKRGVQGETLDTFYARVANGTLPEVSYIVSHMEISEHPPFSTQDGAWFQDMIARAVFNSPKYNNTVIIYSYDETGGTADHVYPYHSPEGTPGEWIDDPYNEVGYTFAGPGIRVPCYIISPFTRGGGVMTAHADHNSQILFIEKWQAAKGKNVTTPEMVAWRREHMSDLVDAFDFENPDYSIPDLPPTREPHRNAFGDFDGSVYCESRFPNPRPPVPYKGPGVIRDMASVVEHGFKPCRGTLTEGRYLVIEADGLALTQLAGLATGLAPATRRHELVEQRWIVHHEVRGETDFRISTAAGDLWICALGLLCEDRDQALVLRIEFTASRGYTMQVRGSSRFVALGADDEWAEEDEAQYWKIFSVSY